MSVRLLRSNWVRLGLFFAVGLLLVTGFSLWKRTSALPPTLAPLPQDSLIQVYFNHSQASTYVEPYRHKERYGDNLEQIIIDTINSAQVSVDVAIHELHLPGVARALRDRHQAGVKVRVVTEHDYNRLWSALSPQQSGSLDERDRGKYLEFLQLADVNKDGAIAPDEAAQADSMLILKNAGVPLIDDTADGSAGSALMHHKFAVIDGKTVLTGSVNWSISEVHGDFLSPESSGNANHLIKINSPTLATIFTQEFELMWGNGGQSSRFGLQKPYRPAMQMKFTPQSALVVQFSPTSPSQPWQQSVNGLIGMFLSRAAQTVDMALFVFSDQMLSNVLESRHQQGVQVRGLIDRGFMYRDYSEGLDMLGTALTGDRCQYEDGNKPWSQAIATVGVPQLAEGDILHHKFAVVDHRIVITGSQNWTAAANQSNDENLLVIDNPTVAAHFEREFERLYQTAELGIPT
ncbi:MAG TPA: phospholipase D-like domain-containing protein, partial [Chroococcidiopsis sp.]